MENEELIKIAEERGKLDSHKEGIKNFIKLITECDKLMRYWQTGGTFVECEGCGGLCREKTGD